MPIVSLSDMTLRTLKPATTQVTHWDKGLKSFGIRVSPGGTMTWVLLLGQERQRIKLGNYPVIGLKDARELARRHLAERTLGQHKRRAVSFQEALDTFEATHLKNKRQKTTYELKRLLKKHFVPKLGRKQLSDLDAHHVTDITDRLTPGTAWHAYAAVQTFLNWTVARRYISTSPLAGVPSPPKSTPRARVLSDAEVKSIWEACEQSGGHKFPADDGYARRDKGYDLLNENDIAPAALPAHFATIVRLLILTGQRRGEIAALRADYISNDTCTLPASLTKNGREHTFPITSLTLQIAFSSNCRPLLFPARGKSGTPFNGWSKSKTALDRLSGVTDWTLHDIRRTVATRMAEMGIPIHVIEAILNHQSGVISPLARVYNRHNWLAEMRDAMDKWEARLRAIIGGVTS